MSINITQFLIREEKIKTILSPEMKPEGAPAFRTLTIEDVQIYLTNEQALQIAAAITNQMAEGMEEVSC